MITNDEKIEAAEQFIGQTFMFEHMTYRCYDWDSEENSMTFLLRDPYNEDYRTIMFLVYPFSRAAITSLLYCVQNSKSADSVGRLYEWTKWEHATSFIEGILQKPSQES